MFLDANGTPKEVTAENLYGYECNLHGVMLLTSADNEVYIPPRWHGTIYSTEEILDRYRKQFKIDSTLLTFHALKPFEPEQISCERCVVEITVLPAGRSLYSYKDIAVFLVKINDVNTLITKEVGISTASFPGNHHYRARMLNEGIDILYVDGNIWDDTAINYQSWCVAHLAREFEPQSIRSLTGEPLPGFLNGLCRRKTLPGLMRGLRLD